MHHNRPNRRSLFVATFIIIALFVFDLATGLVRAPVRALGAAVDAAAAGTMAGITRSGLFAAKAQLAGENEALKRQVAQLSGLVAAAQVAEAENKQLRAMAHLAASARGVTAPVLSSYRVSPYGTFLIGAGSKQGIAAGSLVLSQEGFVIGRVRNVEPNTSLVTGIFAPGESIDTLIGGVPVTLQGMGGGNARGSAARGARIATGTPALAPVLGQRAVGFVAQTKGDETSSSVQVAVRTPVNMATLSYVYVETTQ